MAVLARLMSQGISMIKGVASEIGCTIIFINQLRSTMAMYGPSITTTGGKTLPFYASQRLELKRKGWIKEGEDVIGFHQFIKVVKNKVGPPFKTITNDIIYGQGVDTLTGMVELAVEKGVLERKGAYYKIDGESIAQGIKKLRILLNDNPDLVDEIKNRLNNLKTKENEKSK